MKQDAEAAPPRDPFSVKTSNLFFGSSSLGAGLTSIESWQPGAEPLIIVPDPDMKVMASLPSPSDDVAAGHRKRRSVAPKGEVNADNQRAKSPAERLGLLDEQVTREVGKVPRRGRLFRDRAAKRCAARWRSPRW